MNRAIAVVTWYFALSVLALAHGNEKHLMGKVTSISDNSITVETTSKQSVTVELAEQTKKTCPVSVVLAGAQINLDAKLVH